jgi:hypothetical protein
MRYQKAVPEIEKLCKIKPPLTATWASGMHSSDEPEISLIRLTGNWGEAGDGVRLLFLPPEKAVAGKPMPAVVLIENASNKDLDVTKYYFGAVIVDGVNHQLPEGGWDGRFNLDIGDVWFRPIDLDEMIKTPGKHAVQYQVGNAKSNVLSIEVSVEKDRQP